MQGTGIYPAILPPPDFFDLDDIDEELKNMFKKDHKADNPLHDENGAVNLPGHEK